MPKANISENLGVVGKFRALSQIEAKRRRRATGRHHHHYTPN